MPSYVFNQSTPAPGHQMPTVYQTTETTESRLRCVCPWSLIVLCIGLSCLLTGVVNLGLTNWIYGGVLTGVGVVVTLLGWVMWRKDRVKMASGGTASGPFDMLSAKPVTTTSTRTVPPAQPQQVVYVQPTSRKQERSGSVKV